VWNRIPDDVRSRVVTLALDEPELSARELAVRFTDAELRIPTIATTHSDGSRPAVPIDRDQCGAGAEGAVG
jgi:hypothetical protein